jgi:IS5 family transposase
MKTFFDVEDRLERLEELGDVLVRLNQVVNWGIFQSKLEEIFYTEDNRAGGRQAFNRVMMFKILVLQGLYNIADDNTEYQINDRLSFQRFLGLDIGDKVPDAKTIWAFKERLRKSGREKELFYLYTQTLERAGLITRRGSIIDATFVERPRQRKERKDNKNEGEGSEQNKALNPENVHQSRQIDQDARLARKRGRIYYGYKNHIKVDADSKLIIDFLATSADRHDGKEAPNILDDKDQTVYMDACYRGREIEASMRGKAPQAQLNIVRKHDGYYVPTQEQEQANIGIEKIRKRVEHIFGYMTKAMGGKQIRGHGLGRAQMAIMLKNLAYNMRRASFLLA